FGLGGSRLLFRFRCPGAALVFFALLRSRLFGFALIRLALRFLRGLASRLAFRARLLLALLGSLLQNVQPLLRIDRERRFRETPDETLQRGRIGRVLYPVPLQRFLRRHFAAGRRRLRERGEIDVALTAQRLDLGAREIGVEAGRVRTQEDFPGTLRADLLHQFIVGLDVVGRRLRRYRRCRHERDVAAAERAIDK